MLRRVTAVAVVIAAVISAAWYIHGKKRRRRRCCIIPNIAALVGDTPLLRIASLSSRGDVLAKLEFLNPGGSPKDRVALAILRDAFQRGLLTSHPLSTVFEGTSGSTGIALALLARSFGIRCYIVVPNDVAMDKVRILQALGAEVERVPPSSIALSTHYVNVARRRAVAYDAAMQRHEYARNGDEKDVHPSRPRGYFANQFDNPVNAAAHYASTAPEIWQQCAGQVDAFVTGAGTGGTLAGVARYLKERRGNDVRVVVADPQGSGLFTRIRHGVMYAGAVEAEGTRKRHQVDSIVEGIGLNRMTDNLALAIEQANLVDAAEHVSDQQAVWMARWVMVHDGLFIGSSSAVNLVVAARLAQRCTPGSHIVTLLCDSGQRHLSKFWDDDVLHALGLDTTTPASLDFIEH